MYIQELKGFLARSTSYRHFGS